MKTLDNLHLPFNDAVNYRSSKEKVFFSKIFLTTKEIDKIVAPTSYFLIGEKGSGKTAYAVYLESNSRNNTISKLYTINETEYKRFIRLKINKKLEYSDYSAIWRPTLLLLASQLLVEKGKKWHDKFTGKFSNIENAIATYNKSALNPEIESAFELVASDTFTTKASLGDKSKVSVDSTSKEESKDGTTVIKYHLRESETKLKEGISSMKLDQNYILFIDGVDLRPEGVDYREYIECLKGLSDAMWHLNTDFFQRIKDSKGRIKIVILLRPDIFHVMNVYNSNSRIYDNCVMLNWSTTEKEYKDSNLYRVSGRYFSSQQEEQISENSAWEYYFPNSTRSEKDNYAFKYLIKTTFQKPRDILTAIKILLEQKRNQSNYFENGDLQRPEFTRQFSDYLLGEVKNYASFYMTPLDFNHHLKFFMYLNGKTTFPYSAFEEAYKLFKQWVDGEEIKCRQFLADAEAFLQFLYDVNCIGFIEKTLDNERYYHWSHREKTINNFQPKIKKDCTLIINPGIAKALELGKTLNTKVSDGNHRGKSSSSKTRKQRH